MRKNPCTDGHNESPIHEAERSSHCSNRIVDEEPFGIKSVKTYNIENVIGNASEILSKDENIPNEQNKNKSKRKDKNNNVFIIILNGECTTSRSHSSSSKKDSKKILDLSSAFLNDDSVQDNISLDNVNLSLRKIKNIQNDVYDIISFTNKNNAKAQQQNSKIGPKCFLVLNCSVASDKCDPTLNQSLVKQHNSRCTSTVTTESVGKSKSNIQKSTENMAEENLIQVKQENDSFILVVKDDIENRGNTLKQSDEASFISEQGGTDTQQSIASSEEEYDSLIETFMIKRKYKKQQRKVIIKYEDDIKYYTCDKCNIRYTNLKSLKTHHYTRCFDRKHRITNGAKLTRKKNLKLVVEVKVNDRNESAPQKDPRRSFSCRKCGDCFEDKQMYRNHIRYRCKVSRAVPFICEFCGKEFRYRSTFWAHKKAHKNLRDYVCQECGKGYNTLRILTYHIKRVHMGQQCLYFCAYCGIKSKSKSHIEAHEKIHFLSEGETIEKPFHCKCGESFISQHELSNHNYVYHVNKKCPHCSERFLSINKLKQHKKEVHTNKVVERRDTTQQCPLCQKVYASIISFKQHLQNIHRLDDPNVARRIECNVCYKTYTSFAYYINHKREVHNEAVSAEEIEAFKEIIVPPWEQEVFAERRRAREERRIRRRERRSPEAGNRRGRPPGQRGPKKFDGTEHVCNICGKTFTKRHLMKSHMIRVHSAEGAYCNLCQIEFINKGQYYRHRYEIHVCAEEERTCGVCGKVFDKIRSLWAHKIVHNSVTFGCPECDSRFKRKGDLTRHLRGKHNISNASRQDDLGEMS